jgi:hypothetical protein
LKQLNRLREFSLIFDSVRFVSAQLMLSPPFSLCGAASPLVDVATPPHHVTLPFQ